MLFNSIEFMLFCPLVASVYFMLPYERRVLLLLGASYVFYMAWNPFYLILILASTLVDYWAARAMEASADRFGKRRWLYLSLGVNLGLLFLFKYANFAGEVIQDVLGFASISVYIPYKNILLPVGISFYTFQTLSYTIEVYRGNQKAIRRLDHFALYVSFFPQLVAGPIERPQRLLPQLIRRVDFEYERVVSGMRTILWGLFKKVVIADRLSVVVDAVYMEPERYPGSILMLATVFFAFQIYCDFSGYTDIAIGSARIFGIDLMKNFNRPYFATSIADFWRRWHISLSTWFRDYVYLPLGGSRGSKGKWVLALIATFGLSGLWHGANWTFIVWGFLHVGYYLVGTATAGVRGSIAERSGVLRLPHFVKFYQVSVTFSLVCVGWIFFRADSIESAFYILTHLGDRWLDFTANGGFGEIVASWDISMRAFELDIMLIGFLLITEAMFGRDSIGDALGGWVTYLRWPVYVGLCLAIMNLGETNEIPFVYFQF
ncbi:MBOAT family protein [bacterium AH-315-P07]|nr:MBOAT family protein [bacterium AH-315-P07]